MLSIENGWTVSIARWFRSDDRRSCITRLTHIVDECKTALRVPDANTPRMIQHLGDALNGIVNLQRTYEVDVPTSHEFELLAQTVKGVLAEYRPIGEDIEDVEAC